MHIALHGACEVTELWCVVCAHREYYKTLRCLHYSLINCTEDDAHLYDISNRIGHLHTSMEQTCSSSNSRATTAVDRHPPVVTSRHHDVVTGGAGHVTLSPTTARIAVTRRAVEDGDSLICSQTTAGAPLSQPLHGSATSSAVASLSTSASLISAGILAVLRRHCSTWRRPPRRRNWRRVDVSDRREAARSRCKTQRPARRRACQ